MLLPRSTNIQYCGEPPWPRGSVFGLRPPEFEFRRAVSSHSSHHSQEVLPAQFSLYRQRWPKTQFISFHFISQSESLIMISMMGHPSQTLNQDKRWYYSRVTCSFYFRGDEWWKVEFAQTPVPMTNYLVAFAVGDFDYIDDVADGGLSSKYVSIITCI